MSAVATPTPVSVNVFQLTLISSSLGATVTKNSMLPSASPARASEMDMGGGS